MTGYQLPMGPACQGPHPALAVPGRGQLCQRIMVDFAQGSRRTAALPVV